MREKGIIKKIGEKLCSPKVSVIIPSYNEEEGILVALESIKKQSFKDFEVLIVDDGSTDRTGEIVKEYCITDKRFRYFFKENGGTCSAKNLGIRNARGKYIVFYDADDYVPDNSLKSLYECIKKDKATLGIGLMETIDCGDRTYSKKLKKLASGKKVSRWNTNLTGAFGLPNKIFLKRIIDEKNILFDEALLVKEDGVFLFNYLVHARRIATTSDTVYQYRKRSFLKEGLSLSSRNDAKKVDMVRQAYNKICDSIEEFYNSDLNNRDCNVEELDNKYYKLKTVLTQRMLITAVFNELYARIWQSDDEAEDKLIDLARELSGELPTDETDKLEERFDFIGYHRDTGMYGKKKLANNPVFAIVIDKNVGEETLNNILNALYNQDFQVFEVLVNNSVKDKLKREFYSMENLRFYDGDVDFADENITKARYVNFIDGPVYPNRLTIKKVYTQLYRRDTYVEYDAITVGIRSMYGDNEYLADDSDKTLANKYFKKDALQRIEYKYTGGSAAKQILSDKNLKYGFFDGCTVCSSSKDI